METSLVKRDIFLWTKEGGMLYFVVDVYCAARLSRAVVLAPAVCRLLGGVPAYASLRLCRIAAMGRVIHTYTIHRVLFLFYETGVIS